MLLKHSRNLWAFDTPHCDWQKTWLEGHRLFYQLDRVYLDLHNINIADLSGGDSLAGQWRTTRAEWITVIHYDVGSRWCALILRFLHAYERQSQKLTFGWATNMFVCCTSNALLYKLLHDKKWTGQKSKLLVGRPKYWRTLYRNTQFDSYRPQVHGRPKWETVSVLCYIKGVW